MRSRIEVAMKAVAFSLFLLLFGTLSGGCSVVRQGAMLVAEDQLVRMPAGAKVEVHQEYGTAYPGFMVSIQAEGEVSTTKSWYEQLYARGGWRKTEEMKTDTGVVLEFQRGEWRGTVPHGMAEKMRVSVYEAAPTSKGKICIGLGYTQYAIWGMPSNALFELVWWNDLPKEWTVIPTSFVQFVF